MIRGLLRLFGALVLLVLVVAVVAWLELRAPSPMSVPEQGAVIRGVTVVNPGSGRLSARTIRIEGERIAAIEPAEPASEGGPFQGAFALPGLVDMHVHHPPAFDAAQTHYFALLYLLHGVTTVRDTGNFDGSILETRRQILDGAFPGPRVFACGPILDGDPPIWPNSVAVETVEDARSAVGKLAVDGVHCVKVYSLLQPEALAAIRDAAAEHGLPVIGHVPESVGFEDAHLADAQHLIGVPDPRSGRSDEFFLARGWPELSDARIEFIVKTSLDQGIAHTPTLVVLEHISHLDEYELQRSSPSAQLLPRFYRDVFWNPDRAAAPLATSAEVWARYRSMVANAKRVVRALHEAGVTLHAGSDTLNPFVVPGASLHEELALLVDSRLTPEEAWVTATRTPGEFLLEPGLGVIEVGAPADVLIFRDDPTSDLEALETLEAVVAGGRLYPRAELDRAVVRYRDHFEGWIYDRVSVWLGRAMMPPPGDDASEEPAC